MSILVITTEPFPYPGMPTTGAGLRAYALSEGLKTAGLDVVSCMPDHFIHDIDSSTALSNEEKKTIRENCFSRTALTEFIQSKAPDAVVLQHWGLAKEIRHIECPLAIDLAGPHLLERLYWGSDSYSEDLYEKLDALRAADFITCSGYYQRHYFLPFLLMTGWDIREFQIPVIPFSMNPELPAAETHDRSTFVYTGILLPWQNPSAQIRWLLEALEARQNGELRFIGGVHPYIDVSRGTYETLLDTLEKHPHVTMSTFKPFEDFIDEIKTCGTALDLVARNPERELAFTSRTVVYLWCGLPVIYNNYSELSGLIEDYGAGWTLSPDDEAELKKIVRDALDNPHVVEEKSHNAQRLVREQLTWDKTIAPLAEFCKSPYFRKGKQSALLSFEARDRELATVRKEAEQSHSELLTLKGKKIFKLYHALGKARILFAPFLFVLLFPLCLMLLVLFLLSSLFSPKPRRT